LDVTSGKRQTFILKWLDELDASEFHAKLWLCRFPKRIVVGHTPINSKQIARIRKQ